MPPGSSGANLICRSGTLRIGDEGTTTSHGDQRVRLVHRRDRPVELAHGRPDEGRSSVCRRPCAEGQLDRTARVHVELFGSLGATGRGHGSDRAVLLGLEGADPATVDTASIGPRVEAIRQTGSLSLNQTRPIEFAEKTDLVLHRRQIAPLPPERHDVRRVDTDGAELRRRTYYSVGGGFVVDDSTAAAAGPQGRRHAGAVPVPLRASTSRSTAADRPADQPGHAGQRAAWRSETEVREGLLEIWHVMEECVDRGCRSTDAQLPGGLKVRRRAPALAKALEGETFSTDPLQGHGLGQPVRARGERGERRRRPGRDRARPTAPPASSRPCCTTTRRFVAGRRRRGRGPLPADRRRGRRCSSRRTPRSPAPRSAARARSASACSMAAAGLAAVLGGTHRCRSRTPPRSAWSTTSGLTCDPIGGLVQIPCIERNAIASVKAINAARLALHGDGAHIVSLDKVIKTMRDTGARHEGQVQGDLPRRPRRQRRSSADRHRSAAPLGPG